MKTKFKSKLLGALLVLVMVLALVPVSALTAFAAGNVRVDFCLTNGALENNVFFENDSSKYFMSQQTKDDGTLTSLEELYRTDSLDLEFDGWYTQEGEKVTLETVFTEYTILYDRWKETTLTDEDIISTLEINTPLLEVGKLAGTYDTNSITLTDNRLSIQNVSVYEGLNAYRTNKLDDSDVLEAGKSYSLRVELHTKNGELIDDQLMSHSTATYGLVANMVYSHDNSGIFTTQWTNRENKIQVIINYDFENYCFTSDLEDKVVENGQSPQYTVYVSNNANVKGMELFVKNANDTWASLGAVTGQFNIPANNNIVKQYRVEVTYQNGFVISSNTFNVDWYDPNAPKFITQPTDYNVANGTNVQVSWALNFDSSSIIVERYNGENWVEYQSAYNDGAQISSMPESGTYTFRAHATKNGQNYYSEEFTITWREKFVFTTQPQSITVSTGESAIVTWETNLLETSLQTLGAFQLQTDTGSGWHRSANLAENDTSYNFGVSNFAYSQKYRLMANYDGTLYYSDEFTIEYIAGVFTSKPADEINAIVGKDCLVEWDFSLDVKYYNIKVHDGNDFVQFAKTDKPEYNFTASEVGEKQFFIQAYNANDQIIGEDYLMFRINWTEQQIVYLVSFNANGGTGTMQPVEQIAGSQYTLPTCTFTAPDGKKFKAWSVNDVKKNVGDKIIINANTVVKAVWEDNEVIYSYCTNGAEGSNEMGYATVGEEITLDSCTFTAPEGKRFKAWAIGSVNGEQKQPGDKITITEETYIYAIWEDLPHECVGVIESGQGATCTVDGWKDYYRCECGKYYEDANCEILIPDLEAWKVGDGKITAEHSGTAVWTTTATTHTKKYTCCDTFVVETEAHEWNNGVCSECGYVCLHTSVAVTKKDGQGATCTVDGYKDYYQCACGKYFADEARTTPIADLEAWKANDGRIAAEHKYGDLIAQDDAVHTQTELEAGMKAHYKCSVCQSYFDENKNPTTENALIIPAPQHSYGDWVKDNEKHWKACSCGLKADEHTHNYTDNADMTCNDCGFDRTVLHTCGNGTKQDGQGATCTVNGWKDYYKCSCGKIYTDAACTNEITSFEEWKNGDGKIAAGHSYGDLIAKADATCSQAGMQAHFECSVCHTLFDADKAVKTENELTIAIDANAHTYGAWTSNGDGTHTRVCSLNAEHKENGNCAGGTATCTEKAVCAICNTAYGTTAAHSYGSEWKTDANNHWKECECGDKANKAAHIDGNGDNKCDTCDYTMSVPTPEPTPEPAPTPEPQPTPEPEDKGGLSAGAIVGIVIGSALVAGIGGFSLIWFVIKKNSLADLIGIFKK